MARVQIFLSAVTTEFRRYRDALRHDLDRPNVSVKVQEDFIATGSETLDKLDGYIRQCDGVIHLVGDMTGAMAQAPSVTMIQQRYPDFAKRLPIIAPFLQPGGPTLSYTQWEAWLALYHGKLLIIAVPREDAPRDRGYKAEQSQREAQQAHLARLATLERYPEIHFANVDRLAVDVLRSGLQEILASAGIIQEAGIGGDPFSEYLDACYESINHYLSGALALVEKADDSAHGVRLTTVDTPRAVDALFGRGLQYEPLFRALDEGEVPAAPAPPGTFDDAFAKYHGRILLLGEAGAGKTITLFHFARDAIVRRKQDRSLPLPILGFIRKWDDKQASIADWLDESNAGAGRLSQVVREGRALLLLDGLDEAPSVAQTAEGAAHDPRSRFIELIPSNNQVVVTCRIKDYREVGLRARLNGAVTLLPMDDNQIRSALAAHVQLLAAFEADSELREALRRPLLLKLFAEAYRDIATGQIEQLRNLRRGPADLRESIIRKVIEQRYRIESQRESTPPPFTLGHLYEIFGRVLVETLGGHRGHEALWSDQLGPSLERDEQRAFIDLSVKLNLLVQEDEGGPYQFVHPLIRDHFAFPFALRELGNRKYYRRPPLASSDPSNPALALGTIGDPRAVARLTDALNNPHALVRRCSATALGQIGDPRAIEPLIVALDDEETGMSAALALGRFRDTALQPLLATLSDSRSACRRGAAVALGELGIVAAAEPLVQALSDIDADVRSAAAKALGQIGHSCAVEPLIRALGDPDSSVAGDAAAALGALGDQRAVDALLEMLERSSDHAAAAHALGELGDPRCVDALIGILHDADEYVRYEVAGALGRFGQEKAVPTLSKLLDDRDQWVRDAALSSLADLGAIHALAGALRHRRHEVRFKAASVLGRCDDSAAVPPLIGALDDDHTEVRLGAARSLGTLGDRRAVQPLIARLCDRKKRVRIAAIRALGSISDPRAIGPLTNLLSNREMGFWAESALRTIGTPDALAAVAAWQGTSVEKSTRARLRALLDLAFPVVIFRIIGCAALLASGLTLLTSEEAAAAYRQHVARGTAVLALPASVAAGLALIVALGILAGFASRLTVWVGLTGLVLGIAPRTDWNLASVICLALLATLPAQSFPGPLSVDHLLQRFSWHRVLASERLARVTQNVWLLVVRISTAVVLMLPALTMPWQLEPQRPAFRTTASESVVALVLAIFLATGLGGRTVPLAVLALVHAGLIPSLAATKLSSYIQHSCLLSLFVLLILGAGDLSVRAVTLKRFWKRL